VGALIPVLAGEIVRDIFAGLIGFGTIGTGVIKLLRENEELIRKRLGARLVIKKIADVDIETPRQVPVEREKLTTDVNEILTDPDISIIVELVGGYTHAKTFVLEAIRNGKHVVTANKALLANYGNEIFSAADDKKVNIGFEASVGGQFPL